MIGMTPERVQTFIAHMKGATPKSTGERPEKLADRRALDFIAKNPDCSQKDLHRHTGFINTKTVERLEAGGFITVTRTRGKPTKLRAVK